VRVILDTNVFVSGVFFGGPPGRILAAWRDGRVQPVLSAEILEEYRRVGQILGGRYPGVDLEPFLALLAVHADFVDTPALPEPVSSDPDDDKFLACAVAAGVTMIVSGDKDLVEHSGWRGVHILRPRRFVDEYLAAP
jgi:putative PIN family toxin of toxin-antitoxin system